MRCKIVMLEKIRENKKITEQDMGNYVFKGELYETLDNISFKPCGIKTFSVMSDGLLSPQIKDECNRTLLAEIYETSTDNYQIERIINIEPLPNEK